MASIKKIMDGRKVTLKVFADRWLEEYAKPKLQPGTVKSIVKSWKTEFFLQSVITSCRRSSPTRLTPFSSL